MGDVKYEVVYYRPGDRSPSTERFMNRQPAIDFAKDLGGRLVGVFEVRRIDLDE